ncbi:hypothetical protein FIBSPDRAFT_220446 [Athelia psychrophila]|uniref:Uncharacterized protein n=1 Tax=Athelia psychrophila TaxID=1759441 RepID=A0A165Z429_9AGAM|nr:hypothetical protein FIBSPDRAFT_220446 [Fibularhizoctonia sp. CBS 109695]
MTCLQEGKVKNPQSTQSPAQIKPLCPRVCHCWFKSNHPSHYCRQHEIITLPLAMVRSAEIIALMIPNSTSLYYVGRRGASKLHPRGSGRASI